MIPVTHYIPQFNRSIPNELLAEGTAQLKHTHYMNGSICEHGDKKWYAYRTDQRPFCTKPRLYITEMDAFLVPSGRNTPIKVNSNTWGWRSDYLGTCNEGYRHRGEDPRLLSTPEGLFLFYTDGFKMYYGLLEPETGELKQWCPRPPTVVELTGDKRYDGREKNWTPFWHKDALWCIYCYSPFVACRLVEDEIVESVWDAKFKPHWKYGFIKGGTPAIRIGDEYITVFHSSMKQGDLNYYYAGALAFDAKTLFPTRISRHPLISPYNLEDYDNPTPNQIIFPAGLIYDSKTETLLISYGYNDHSTKVCAVSMSELDYNMRPVHVELDYKKETKETKETKEITTKALEAEE